jgi:hypothetical protein
VETARLKMKVTRASNFAAARMYSSSAVEISASASSLLIVLATAAFIISGIFLFVALLRYSISYTNHPAHITARPRSLLRTKWAGPCAGRPVVSVRQRANRQQVILDPLKRLDAHL